LNLKPYIESGILELYALNSLPDEEKMGVERMLATYPELRAELNGIERALESYATSRWVKPADHLEKLVIDSLENLAKEKIMDPNDLPLINRFADYKNWLPLFENFEDLSLENGRHVKVLRHDEKVTQMLIVSTTDIEEETHQAEYESFLILSGQCKCTVGDQVRLMGPGDFMEIPLDEVHDVSLVSPKVMAILQHIKI
jgi:mannose-6-phosphate isomerase-like protein (cupin superfamily)